jgi:ribosomal-protein-alanine N-acetyltransferase
MYAVTKPGTVKLMSTMTTQRLILRRWQERDREPFAALNADPEVMRHLPALLSRDDSDALIDAFETRFDDLGFGLWALELKDSGEFIGFTGLSVPRFSAHFMPAVEVGWRLTRVAWGHGYATEAARQSLAYGFDVVRLTEIVSFTTVGNLRSRKVMERIGMTHDPADDFDHPILAEGHPLRPHVLYRLPAPVSTSDSSGKVAARIRS